MSTNSDQFKATQLWNRMLSFLNYNFAERADRKLSGKEIYQYAFAFFTENSEHTVTEEKIKKLCQILMDSYYIYESSNTSAILFKNSKKIYYRSPVADRAQDKSEFNNNITMDGRELDATNAINNDTDDKTFCLERKMCLRHLLKHLDISMIRYLVDLCELSNECNHRSERCYSWQCNEEQKFALQADGFTSMVHYNCLQLSLGPQFLIYNKINAKTLLAPSDLNFLSHEDMKLLVIVRYISTIYPNGLWPSLNEVFQCLSLILDQTKNYDKVLQCLQLAFNLMSDEIQHLSYHLFFAIGKLLPRIPVPRGWPTRNRYIMEYYNCLFKFNLADHTDPNIALIKFIAKHYDKMLLLPEELKKNIVSIKEHTLDITAEVLVAPVFAARVSAEQCQKHSAAATNDGLRQLYEQLTKQMPPFHTCTVQEISEKIDSFKKTFPDFVANMIEEDNTMIEEDNSMIEEDNSMIEEENGMEVDLS